MGSVALEPASNRSYAELAEIFNAGYEGYFTPFAIDEAAFRFMSITWDDDLDASRVAVVDGRPAGICKLGIRGESGWIGGMGVAVPHRGQGVGETLLQGVLEEGRARGLSEVWLEVLVQNEPAIKLYEKLGFAHERELEVWTVENFVADSYPPAPLEATHERIRAERTWREPWQRADPSVANHENVEALASEHGAVLFRRTGERVSLLQGVAADPNAARDLLQGLPAEATSMSWLNGPAGDPFNLAIESIGGTLAHRQHEMVLEL